MTLNFRPCYHARRQYRGHWSDLPWNIESRNSRRFHYTPGRFGEELEHPAAGAQRHKHGHNNLMPALKLRLLAARRGYLYRSSWDGAPTGQ